MTYQYNIAILPLLLAAFISMGVAWYVWQLRARRGAMALVVLATAAAIWSLGYALEIAGADLPTKLFWGKLQYFGIGTVPLTWFLFAWQYTGRYSHPTRRTMVWLSIIPATTILLALTTDWHGLVWRNYNLVTSGNLLTLEISHGPWFWVYWVYSQLLILAGTILILRAQLRPLDPDDRPIVILLIAALAPWAGNLSYITGLTPIDLTPFAFALSAAAITFAVFRFRLVYLLPVARETIIEDMRDGVIVLDTEGIIADMNPAAQQIFGFTADTVLGQSAARVFQNWPDLVEKYRYIGEARDEIVVTTDGERRIYELQLSTVRNRRGRDHERIITIRNITQTKLAEEALARQATTLATLYQLSQQIVSTLDSEQVYAAAHQAVAQLMPVEAFFIALVSENQEEVEDVYLFDRGHRWPNDRHTVNDQSLTAQIIHSGQPLWIKDDSHGQSHKMGRILFGEPEDTLSILIAPLKLHGRVTGVISAQHYQPNIYSDNHLQMLVTLGNQVAIAIENAHLVRSLRLQAAVLDATANAIIITDTNSVIQWINPAFTLLTGYSATEAIGQTPRLLRSGKHNNAFYQDLWATSKSGQIWQGEIINQRKDGSLYVEWQTITPIYDEKGEVSRFIAVKQDITELVKAKEQALEASRLKSQLLARVNHELRTPLGAILGYAELLQANMYGSLTGEQVKVLTEIIESSRQLTDMVNELLDEAQLEMGALKIQEEPFAPRALLEEIEGRMIILAQQKGLTLSASLDKTLPYLILGDESRLHQILINLIGNAIKFTRVGEVHLSLIKYDESHWAMSVQDTGPGIPQEAQAYIFDPFRQIDGSSTREHRGSGLGLSIVKQLTTLMGGEIHLQSEMGHGSTFTIVLPLKNAL
ncbi:MAG: PAS domain S-box protein [Chloroflexi bacterium]|nr:PAS domain S-box protein [Chloroflexota bacterium]MBP8057931.1 PAS domain S-box protein [Chloroflexota bacterium]